MALSIEDCKNLKFQDKLEVYGKKLSDGRIILAGYVPEEGFDTKTRICSVLARRDFSNFSKLEECVDYAILLVSCDETPIDNWGGWPLDQDSYDLYTSETSDVMIFDKLKIGTPMRWICPKAANFYCAKSIVECDSLLCIGPCKNYHRMVEPNCKDNQFMCFSCRSSAPWKFKEFKS